MINAEEVDGVHFLTRALEGETFNGNPASEFTLGELVKQGAGEKYAALLEILIGLAYGRTDSAYRISGISKSSS
jgi:hypothetical protein